MTNEEAQGEIKNLRDHAVGLTDWEASFLQSISEALEAYGNPPTEKQVAIIDKIRRDRLP